MMLLDAMPEIGRVQQREFLRARATRTALRLLMIGLIRSDEFHFVVTTS